MSRKCWTPEADAILCELYLAQAPMERITEALGCTENGIRQRVMKLHLHRERADIKHWSDVELHALRMRYPHELTADLAREFGCSEYAVYNKAHHLGLYKSDVGKAMLAERARQNALTDPRVIAGRIKPGAVPPNKGKKMPPDIYARCAPTMFRKGEMRGAAQHNYVPIGTEKYDVKRGATVRKVSDDQSIYPAKRWVSVARIVWEAANGPVPVGHIVRFRAGMKTLVSAEITLDKLELVTLRENMLRNTIHNYPREIQRAMQMRGALSRVLNRKHKEASAS